MGITGLIPFLDKASRRANVGEFSGCTVAIDSYCWLHKGAFACADKLVRGEDTDIHIRYCLKYVTMLLSKNIKPILVFDGRHLPAKALTESKRRESRNISKKRAAELLSLGKTEEARSYMRRSVDITHSMALSLIQECRKRNVDCIVAPYEADAQLAFLNMNNIAHLVITEDSDLILFGCTKVLFKMDLDGMGTLVETAKLPLVMKCPIENYSFDKFRQMCIMSGCDYLPSLPGIGLAKARQFVNATQDSNFANALKKLPSFYNRSNLTVTDEYRENFLKAEATFKYQYVYNPLERKMVRLTDPEDEDIEKALCINAGELLADKVAFQLALGNLDPFTLKKMDDWHPDTPDNVNNNIKTQSWKDKGVSNHCSMWSDKFPRYMSEDRPWQKVVKKLEPIISAPKTRAKKKVVNLITKYVPETQDESLTVEALSSMYCMEPAKKKIKSESYKSSETYTQDELNQAILDETNPSQTSTDSKTSPILQNKERSFKKGLSQRTSILKRLSKFPRTVMDNNIVESKFFSTSNDGNTVKEETSKTASIETTSTTHLNKSITIEESPEKISRNPFKVKESCDLDETYCSLNDLQASCKENLDLSPRRSPVLEINTRLMNGANSLDLTRENDSEVIENTYPLETLVTPVDSQNSFGESQPNPVFLGNRLSQAFSRSQHYKVKQAANLKKSNCKVPGLKKIISVPGNQPTLISMFGFQKKPILKR